MTTIKLYNVGFNSDQNAVVDSIESYLSTLTPIYSDTINYVKIDLDIVVNLRLDQEMTNNPSFNYVRILMEDNTRPFYYYLSQHPQWLSKEAVRLNLSMDTLNTFQDLLIFSDKTNIIRQHKDRFNQDYYNPLFPSRAIRIVDRMPEIQGLIKYKDYSNSISGEDNIKWYLIYANDNDNANAPVSCYVAPSENVNFYGEDSTYNPPYFNTGYTGDIYLIKENRTLTILTTTNQTITLRTTNSQTYYISTVADGTYFNVIGKGNSTQSYGCKEIGVSGTTHLCFYNRAKASELLNLSATLFIEICKKSDPTDTMLSSGGYTLSSIGNVNRTYSTLIKIIECPYEPFTLTASNDGYQIPSGFQVSNTLDLADSPITLLKLDNLEKDFEAKLNNYAISEYDCTLPAVDQRALTLKNPIYESKLYHSDFYSLIFNYDSFTKEEKVENLIPSRGASPYFKIYYKQANTITSNLGFRFDIQDGNHKTNEIFDKYLIAKRNNEIPIYNSSYLNYIRNGYNYDLKAKANQAFQNTLNTGLSIGAGIASMLAGTATGGASTALGISLLTSSITSISNLIFNNINANDNLERKLLEAKNTTNSVEASDDLNLLNWYSDNKLLISKYSISDQQKSNVFDILFKTGYSCNEAGIPNTHTRYRFNFVQCYADFATKANPVWQAYINDVIRRFEIGVTYFHTYDDFNQQYENWEDWLLD